MCVAVMGLVAQGIGMDANDLATVTGTKARQAELNAAGNDIMLGANASGNQVLYEGRQALGTQTVTQASGGVDLSSGSPALVAAESARNIAHARAMELYSGQLQARKYFDAAAQEKAKARAAKAGLTWTFLGPLGHVGGIAAKAAYGGGFSEQSATLLGQGAGIAAGYVSSRKS